MLSLALGIGAISSPALAAGTDAAEVRTGSSERRVRLVVLPEFTNISSSTGQVNSLGLGVGVSYALSESWLVASMARQAFVISNLSPEFTQLDFRVGYALTGSLVAQDRQVSLGDARLVTVTSGEPGGFRLEGIASLYFFNSATSVVPLTGLGGALTYVFPSRQVRSYVVGARLDRASNGRITLYPLQLCAGMIF